MSRLPSGDITVLFICTRWIPSQKWIVNDDGLCDYKGEMITPTELCNRFVVENPNLDVIRAEVCSRTTNKNGGRPYSWTQVERFIL